MASNSNLTDVLPLLLLSSLLVLSQANGRRRNSSTHVNLVVRGEVFCQECATSGWWSLLGARPMVGAEVCISCRDYWHNEIYRKSVNTNHAGWYYEPLEGLDLSRHHLDTPAHSCTVRLVSSGRDRRCNVITDTNFGITGSSVRYDKTVYNGTKDETDLYSAGALAFRPPHCRRAVVAAGRLGTANVHRRPPLRLHGTMSEKLTFRE